MVHYFIYTWMNYIELLPLASLFHPLSALRHCSCHCSFWLRFTLTSLVFACLACLLSMWIWVCVRVCLTAFVCAMCCYGRLFVKFVGRLKKRQAKAEATHLAPSFIACDGLLCMLTWLLCNFSILMASVYTHARTHSNSHAYMDGYICSVSSLVLLLTWRLRCLLLLVELENKLQLRSNKHKQTQSVHVCVPVKLLNLHGSSVFA